MSRFIGVVSIVIAGVFFAAVPRMAFQQDDTCAALVAASLTTLAETCRDLGQNQVCSPALSGETQPLSLYDLETLTADALDLEKAGWEVSLANVQANIAGGEEGVVFLLLGGATLENLVSADEALRPAEPVMLTALVGANVRAAPSLAARVSGSVPGGASLAADGISPDGAWLRVVYDNFAGWVNRQVVTFDAAAVAALPVIDDASFSPLQNFCLKTEPTTTCTAAPAGVLLLQAPLNTSATVRANGSNIRLNGTIALRSLPDGRLQLMVLAGTAQVGAQTIPRGFSGMIQLTADACSPAGSWTNVTPLTPSERESLEALANMPVDVLHAPIQIPTEGDIQAVSREFFGVVYGPAAGQINCLRFSPISPLDSVPFGLTTFFWDAVPEIDNYQVKLYDVGQNLLGIYPTNNDNTNLSIDFSDSRFGVGEAFFWEVEAVLDDDIACISRRIPVTRAEPPPQPVQNPANNAGNQSSVNPGQQPTETALFSPPSPTQTLPPQP